MTELILIAASGLAREVLAWCATTASSTSSGSSTTTKPGRASPWTARPSWDPSATPSATRTRGGGLHRRGEGARTGVARLAGLGFPSHRYATVIDPSVRIP